MFYSNQNKMVLPSKVQQFELTVIDGYSYNFNIPEDSRTFYFKAIADLKDRYSFIVQEFHELHPEPPYVYQDFLHFVADRIGVNTTVKGFENPTIWKTSGTWGWNNEERSQATIRVNIQEPCARQNMTIIHETIHILQDLDLDFQEQLGLVPANTRLRITERVAELTAVQVVMPSEKVQEDKNRGLNTSEIAQKYGVSYTMASIG